MLQFILDALRGALALFLVLGMAVLVIWLIVPGMDLASHADAAARHASSSRTFNAMFGGVAIVVFVGFCLLAYASNH